MSERIGNVFVVAKETPQQCDDCGNIEELRPYGPNGSSVCYECAMKDPEGTMAQFSARIDGIEAVEVEARE